MAATARKSAPRTRAVSKFDPVVVKGRALDELLQSIADAINKTHDCIHRGQEEQAERDRVADEKREAIRKDLVAVRVDVQTLKDDQTITKTRVDNLVKLFGVEPVEKGEKRPKGKSLLTWGGWKLLGAVSGCFTLFVVGFQLAVRIAPVIYDYLMGLQP